MEVQLKDRSIDEYKAIIKDDVEKIKKIAEPLRNKKIVHINATAFERLSEEELRRFCIILFLS